MQSQLETEQRRDAMKALVTGATGCIGSHLAEELLNRGHQVRALVRKSSNLSEIQHLPMELFYGDVTDREAVRQAVAGMDVVYHTAARMNDWGPWKIFHEQNIAGTLNLLEAGLESGIKRFVHTSSTGVTGLCALYNTTEDAPYQPQGHYEESKVESEKLVIRFCREKGLPYTIVRPCWTLGPRARRHVPLMIEYLRSGKFKILGNGKNVLSFIDPRDAGLGVYLAGVAPKAEGQIYHITNDIHTVTQEDFYQIFCGFLKVKPPSLHVPVGLAYVISWFMEKWAEWRNWDDAPMLTPVRVGFLGRNRDFSCEKAKRELGYKPRYRVQESLHDAVVWYGNLNKQELAQIPELRVLAGRAS
jgi:nucleoside-diphosphate-sugar epimerase